MNNIETLVTTAPICWSGLMTLLLLFDNNDTAAEEDDDNSENVSLTLRHVLVSF